jgi:hypothetical protein
MPSITQDVIVYHQLQKDSDPEEVTLTAGDAVDIVKEWTGRYLIKASDGKLFNIPKDFVDPST